MELKNSACHETGHNNNPPESNPSLGKYRVKSKKKSVDITRPMNKTRFDNIHKDARDIQNLKDCKQESNKSTVSQYSNHSNISPCEIKASSKAALGSSAFSSNKLLRETSFISDDYGIRNHALDDPKLRRIIDNCGNKQMTDDAKFNLTNNKEFATYHENKTNSATRCTGFSIKTKDYDRNKNINEKDNNSCSDLLLHQKNILWSTLIDNDKSSKKKIQDDNLVFHPHQWSKTGWRYIDKTIVKNAYLKKKMLTSSFNSLNKLKEDLAPFPRTIRHF